MTSSHRDPRSCHWFSRLSSVLDPRSAPRLALLFLGALLARGRRTVTSWTRAAGLSEQFHPCYTTIAAAGRRSDDIAARLASSVIKPLVAGLERLTLALDDTPTRRYGPHVQGAGNHHNPTPGPVGAPYVYGHLWVVLALLTPHAAWGGTLPKPRQPGQRGRIRVYGDERINLLRRARQDSGWTTGWFDLYGVRTRKQYKTFLATWGPVAGVIRVLLVKERSQPTGWVAFFCTHPSASVTDILTAAGDRFAIEIAFRELKQIVGAGQQQVRFIWANIGAFHVCMWTLTMAEAWAWDKSPGELVDRSASPWDIPARRPSHADKRRAWRRAVLREQFHAVLGSEVSQEEIQDAAEHLLNLAA